MEPRTVAHRGNNLFSSMESLDLEQVLPFYLFRRLAALRQRQRTIEFSKSDVLVLESLAEFEPRPSYSRAYATGGSALQENKSNCGEGESFCSLSRSARCRPGWRTLPSGVSSESSRLER